MLAPQCYKPQHPSKAANKPWVYQQAWASVNLPEVAVRLRSCVQWVAKCVPDDAGSKSPATSSRSHEVLGESHNAHAPRYAQDRGARTGLPEGVASSGGASVKRARTPRKARSYAEASSVKDLSGLPQLE